MRLHWQSRPSKWEQTAEGQAATNQPSSAGQVAAASRRDGQRSLPKLPPTLGNAVAAEHPPNWWPSGEEGLKSNLPAPTLDDAETMALDGSQAVVWQTAMNPGHRDGAAHPAPGQARGVVSRPGSTPGAISPTSSAEYSTPHRMSKHRRRRRSGGAHLAGAMASRWRVSRTRHRRTGGSACRGVVPSQRGAWAPPRRRHDAALRRGMRPAGGRSPYTAAGAPGGSRSGGGRRPPGGGGARRGGGADPGRPDNGLLSLAIARFGGAVERLTWACRHTGWNRRHNLHGRDIFAPVAAALAAGEPAPRARGAGSIPTSW